MDECLSLDFYRVGNGSTLQIITGVAGGMNAASNVSPLSAGSALARTSASSATAGVDYGVLADELTGLQKGFNRLNKPQFTKV
jgi:hypothetical protein